MPKDILIFYNKTIYKTIFIIDIIINAANDVEFILAAVSKESLTTYSLCANGFNKYVKKFPN